MREGAIIAQLTATNALPERRDSAWIRRAATSLPEPEGPVMRMRLPRGSHFVDQLAQLGDGRRAADELGVVAGLQLQLFDFALEARGFQRAAHDMDQPVGLERLLDEIVGALLDGGDRGFDRAVAADDHHGQVGMLALEHIQDLDAVEPAPLQPDVEHDQMRTAVGDGRQRAVGIRCDTGLVALIGENPRHELADIDLVVDDEDLRRDQRPVLVHVPTPARA